MNTVKQLYDATAVEKAIVQIAERIAIDFAGKPDGFALVGTQQMGVPLAEKLCALLKEKGLEPDFGKLDITMYRDDFGTRDILPMINETRIPFDVNGKDIILVDDVLSSGRTIRAALDALTDYGRPALIRLAVLVDRGNPEFPIRADFVGFTNDSPAEHKIVVQFDDDGKPAGVYERNWNYQSDTK
jgi:pyrimidine operon attenuation protein/uracil phosphoribosyltransferase